MNIGLIAHDAKKKLMLTDRKEYDIYGNLTKDYDK